MDFSQKKDKKFNYTGTQMLDSSYYITITLKLVTITFFGVKMLKSCHYVSYVVINFIA